jgi:hypothetical protein
MAWRNWGDHPLIVTIGVIAGLCGIVALGFTIWDRLPQSGYSPPNPSPTLPLATISPPPPGTSSPIAISPNLRSGKSPDPETPNPRIQATVYIQISEESQRQQADALRRKLNNAGFTAGSNAKEIELKESDSSEALVRYFYKEDLKVAQLAQELMSREVSAKVLLEFLPKYPDKNPPGFIEVWFPVK